MGNFGSIKNMLHHIDIECEETDDIKKISSAKKIILPGVGSFNAAMKQIKKLGIEKILNQKALEEKIPILGICLGMQLLTKTSEEGDLKGLGFINAHVLKFELSKDFPVPHMGWNNVKICKNTLLSNNLNSESRFYFAHSFYVMPENSENTIFETDYSFNFSSGIQQQNIFGVQFHPEKSHKYGMQLLKNFSEY